MQRRCLATGLLGAIGLLLVLRAPVAQAAEGRITIDNFSFSPASLTVDVGTRVSWVNNDDIPHTILSQDSPHAMESPPLDTGDAFAFTFAAPGRYGYFCSLHPHMQGTIIVQ